MEKQEMSKLILDDMAYETRLTTKFLKRKEYTKPDPKKITAFIPGIIQNIRVRKGEKVEKGTEMMTLEAMKMKNIIIAHEDGRIKEIYVNEGEMVTKNKLLLELE